MNKEDKEKLKKKHILDALKRCLDKEAYSYISMQNVADEAGVSKGGLRYYFPTKESLFIELISDFFSEIQQDHISIVSKLDTDKDRAVISTLYGIERFVLDQRNIKIFINLILYGLEDKKIMVPIQEFFNNHRKQYEEIIKQAKSKMPVINKEEFDLHFKARIAQIIFLSAGLLEAIDPIGTDPSKLTRYVISLFED